MKSETFVSQLMKDEKSIAPPSPEDLMRAIQQALLCLDEGNLARAAQLLYGALPKDLRPIR